MIGFDTNVIIRYFERDDTAQTLRAVALIDSLSHERPGYISLLTLCETLWVMRSSYRADKTRLITVLETLLDAEEIVLDQPMIVRQALQHYTMGDADFSDYLIARLGQAAGCEATVTFDRVAAKSAGMRLL